MKASIVKDVSTIFTCDFQNFEAELLALEKIKQHDEYTYLHSLNVARLSVMLGRRLGLRIDQLTDLGWAALLHDLGKLHVPLNVLNKFSKFTPEELSIMQSHPLESLAAFAKSQPVNLQSLRRLCAAFEHHQRFDLKGYPRVGRKLNLHPFSRIVAIADTFDAMTTDRIYQRRMLPDIALKIMAQGFGHVFDPLILQAFITCMGAYPVGTLVRLSDQNLALVIRYEETSKIDRPTVRLVNTRMDIDLMDKAHSHLKILRSEFPDDHQIDLRAI